LGHWDTPSIGRKRPLVAASAFRDHARAQEPSAAPKPIPPGVCGMWPRGGQLSVMVAFRDGIALPASVTAEPRVGSCGDERLAAGLADKSRGGGGRP
jgi:hypothetical protein